MSRTRTISLLAAALVALAGCDGPKPSSTTAPGKTVTTAATGPAASSAAPKSTQPSPPRPDPG